jgi:prophage regulatory protein
MTTILTKPKALSNAPDLVQNSIANSAQRRPSGFDALPDGAFVREAQLVQSPKRPDSPAPLPFSAPTLWRKVKDRTFPAPVKLSERVTAWRVGDVRAWIAAQALAR